MLVPVGEFEFSVREYGPPDGPAVLLLHGFPQTSRCWDAVAAELAADGYRCLAPDQRGYSPGARPSEVSAYGMPEIVGDTVGLLDALGLDRVHLVGHDWGANVGWCAATWHADRVRTFTAVSVPHPRAYGWAMRNDPEQQRRGAYIQTFVAGGVEDRLLEDDGRRLRRVYGEGVVPADAVEEYVRVLSEPGAMTATLHWYRAAFGADRPRYELPPVRVPTTLVWSTGDAFVAPAGPQRSGEYVEADYRLVELPGVSHWIPEQAPRELVAAVRERMASG